MIGLGLDDSKSKAKSLHIQHRSKVRQESIVSKKLNQGGSLIDSFFIKIFPRRKARPNRLEPPSSGGASFRRHPPHAL